MADIEVRMKTQVVIVQGAMGTMLGSMGFDGCLPFLNLTEPETVEDLHRRYRDAGADCAVTNTFLATPDRLEEYGLADHMAKINEVGVRLAKRAGFPHVLGAIGPCLVEVEPGAALAVLKARRLNATEAMTAEGPAPSYAAAVEQYAAQATALASAGPDALLVESFVRLDDALAAIDGVRRVTDLPVIATMALTADCLVDPADAAQALLCRRVQLHGRRCDPGRAGLYAPGRRRTLGGSSERRKPCRERGGRSDLAFGSRWFCRGCR